MDWTEIITAGIAALGAVGGSALMQSKATAQYCRSSWMRSETMWTRSPGV